MIPQPYNLVYNATVLISRNYRSFRNFPACFPLEEPEAIALFAGMETKTFTAGSTIYEADSESDQTMHLIINGEVSASTREENVYARLRAGDTFGLFSFLDEDRHHSATIRAITDVDALTIQREQFDLITMEEPMLANRMLRFMFHLVSQKALRLENEYAQMHASFFPGATDA